MYVSELSWLFTAQLVRTLAVGLCLGTSTCVMTMYFYLVSKGNTEPAEKKIMHILYTILRIGMCLAVLTEVTNLIYHYHVDNFIYWTDNPELLMRLTIFSVICLNAIAMQHRLVTMWLGPVFAGGSWYAYFFFSVWIETETTYLPLLFGYACWLAFMFVFLAGLRLLLTRHQNNRIGDGSHTTSSAAVQ